MKRCVSRTLVALLAAVAGLHVPYTGGSEANIAVLARQIDSSTSGSSGIAPHVRAGKLRALAVTNGHRVTAVPGVPSVAEFVPCYA